MFPGASSFGPGQRLVHAEQREDSAQGPGPGWRAPVLSAGQSHSECFLVKTPALPSSGLLVHHAQWVIQK